MTTALDHLFEAQQQHAEAQAKAEQEAQRQKEIAARDARVKAEAATKRILKLVGLDAVVLYSETEFIVDDICFKVSGIDERKSNNGPLIAFEITVSYIGGNAATLARIQSYRHQRYPGGTVPQYLPEYKTQAKTEVVVKTHRRMPNGLHTNFVPEDGDFTAMKAQMAQAITDMRESYRRAVEGLPAYESELAHASLKWNTDQKAKAEARAKAEAEEQAAAAKQQAEWDAEQERLAKERKERETREAAEFAALVELAKEALAPHGLTYEQFKDLVKALVAEAINENRCYEW